MSERHPLDRLAARLRDEAERLRERLREFLDTPIPVGTRRLTTPQQRMEAFLALSPDIRQQLVAAGVDMEPAMRSIFDRLGPFGLALLPYIAPLEMGGPEEQGQTPTIAPPPISLP